MVDKERIQQLEMILSRIIDDAQYMIQLQGGYATYDQARLYEEASLILRIKKNG